MKITVKLKAIAQVNEIDIYLSDIGLTVDEWKELSEDAKNQIIDDHVVAEDETNSPYLQLESYHLYEEVTVK
jgi:flavoprotein